MIPRADLPTISKILSKQEPAPMKPWTCIKCRATVYLKPEHHAYLCSLYRAQNEREGQQ